MPNYTPIMPSGDWFCVHLLIYDDVPTWYIDRVALWLVPTLPRSTEEGEPELDAYCGDGQKVTGGEGSMRYVAGSDACPDGRLWAEVFAASRPEFTPNHSSWRDITEAATGWWTQ